MRCYICGRPCLEPARLCEGCQERRLTHAVKKAMTPKPSGWTPLETWLTYTAGTAFCIGVLVIAWNRQVTPEPVSRNVPMVTQEKKPVVKETAPAVPFAVPASSEDEPAVKPPRPPRSRLTLGGDR